MFELKILASPEQNGERYVPLEPEAAGKLAEESQQLIEAGMLEEEVGHVQVQVSHTDP